MISSLAKRLLALSPEEIRQFKFQKPKRTIYRKNTYSEPELIEFLRRRNIKTIAELSRATGKKPSLYAFIKVFGKWSHAQEVAFGSSPSNPLGEPPGDLQYLINLIIDYAVDKVSKYHQLRKEKPDIFPSSYYIYKFGGFRKLRKLADMYTVGDHLESYARLRRRLSRNPTPEECRRENISLEDLLKFFGSKVNMNKFLDEAEGMANEVVESD
jgi:hypothetical protein